MAMKDLVNDTYLKLREAVIVFATENKYGNKNDFEKIKITEDEDIFCSGVSDLLRDLKDLEINVEDIRSSVINKKNKISIQAGCAMDFLELFVTEKLNENYTRLGIYINCPLHLDWIQY